MTTPLHDRRAADTLAAVQQWLAARAERRDIHREQRALAADRRENGWLSLSPLGQRLAEVEEHLAAAKKIESDALQGVARAAGEPRGRRVVRGDAREVGGVVVLLGQ